MQGITMKTLINQTQAIIQLEISQALETYPHHPYQQVFANPDRRQDLTVYVLNHMSSVYSNIDLDAAYHHQNDRSSISSPIPFPTSVGLIIESLVHRGIRYLINQNVTLHEVPSVVDSGRMASSWFG
jgi:hypothetical protein